MPDDIPAGAQIGRLVPETDMNYLTAMAGVFDTQGRATPFATLDNIVPNLQMDRPAPVAERPYEDPFLTDPNALSAGPPVVAINPEGVLDDALPTQLVDSSGAEHAPSTVWPGVSTDHAGATADAANAGVTVVDAIVAGGEEPSVSADGETPAPSNPTGFILDESTRAALIQGLPEGWQQFSKKEMAELAERLGVEIKHTDKATTIANRIKDTLGL